MNKSLIKKGYKGQGFESNLLETIDVMYKKPTTK